MLSVNLALCPAHRVAVDDKCGRARKKEQKSSSRLSVGGGF